MDARQEVLEAIRSGSAARLQALLKLDPSLASARDDSGIPFLLLALYQGRGDLAQILAADRDDLDIFEASALGASDRVSSLLRADPSRVRSLSPDGFTPLHLSSFFGHLGTVRVLLDGGADVNAEAGNGSGLRPIHSAAAHRQPAASLEIVRLLLDRGADPNLKQKGGFTPLHQAAAHAHLRMVELLLDHQGEVNSRTDDGRTPLSLARDKGHDAASELLRRRGGTE